MGRSRDLADLGDLSVSTLKVDTITDTSGGNTTSINSTTPTANSNVGKNKIINGAMEIDQRGLGTQTVNSSGLYTVDRWSANQTAAGKFSVGKSTTAPAGFTNSYIATSLSAYSVSSSDIFFFLQNIEGYNIADLAWGTASAKTITLSFWVRSSLTGTFGGCLANSAHNRSYPFSYTISAADTWEQKSVTVVGDTTGTWATDNTTGIQVIFGLGGGSTRSGTAGSWQAATLYTSTGATSLVGTSGATFYITGVQLEVGSTATEFERRPYGTELQLCYRYFQKFLGSSTYEALPSYVIVGNNTTMAEGFFAYKCTMRAVPSFSINSLCLLDAVSVFALSGITLIAGGVDSSRVNYTGMTGLTTYRSYYVTANGSTSAYVHLSAEL